MDTELMFSSKTGVWATPQEFFNLLDKEFGFDLDAAANEENCKCKEYLSEDIINALEVDWSDYGKHIFCNPPYGRGLGEWFVKAREAQGHGSTVVMLVPARTDTKWFHEHVYHAADEIRFIKGRLKFGGKANAPFPSLVAIYKGRNQGTHD